MPTFVHHPHDQITVLDLVWEGKREVLNMPIEVARALWLTRDCQFGEADRLPVGSHSPQAGNEHDGDRRKGQQLEGSNDSSLFQYVRLCRVFEPMIWSKTNFNGQGSSRRRPTSTNKAR